MAERTPAASHPRRWLAAALALALAGPLNAATLPLRCEFDGVGVAAIYLIDRSAWAARRPDVSPTRTATLEVEPDHYRLAFRPGDGEYRIAVIIDRPSGDAVRSVGPAPGSLRAPGAAPETVVERGRCRARFGEL